MKEIRDEYFPEDFEESYLEEFWNPEDEYTVEVSFFLFDSRGVNLDKGSDNSAIHFTVIHEEYGPFKAEDNPASEALFFFDNEKNEENKESKGGEFNL